MPNKISWTFAGLKCIGRSLTRAGNPIHSLTPVRAAAACRGGRGEGDEDYGCVTIKFTWSPHQALMYSYGPLHQKSVFYSPLPLNSVKRLLMSLCSPEAMWRPPPQTKRKSPDSTLHRRKIKTAPKFFLPFSVEKMNNFLSLKTQCFSVWVKIIYWGGQLVIHNE